MLSLTELRRAVRILDDRLTGARLDKISVHEDSDVVLTFREPEGRASDRTHVLLCARPDTGRLSQLVARPKAPRVPPAFAQWLRARLVRARCEGVRIVSDDRQAGLRLRAKEGGFELLLSILGPRSNVYLLDEEKTLLGALRPLAQTRRVLRVGDPWVDPETAPPGSGVDRWASESDDTFFAAMESAYQTVEGEERIRVLARQLEAALAKEAGILKRKLTTLRRDLDSALSAEDDRRRGELLKGRLGEVRRGARELDAIDPIRGETVRIPLDPKLTPKENLEAIFKRYRKRVRATDHLNEQIPEFEARKADVDALLAEFRALGDGGDPNAAAIEAFAARPRVKEILARHGRKPSPPSRPAVKPRGKQAVPARLLPRRYRSLDGLEIWVGRSDEGNDYLSMRLARGKDLLLHLEASPGSHVVLRTAGRSDPPPDSLLDAAELAVHFSRHRNATQADLHVVPIANVSKPRGAKPGLVYVKGGKTLHLRRDPERLARVLGSRIEE